MLQIGNGTSGNLNGTAGTALTFGGRGTANFNEAAGVNQGMGTLTFTGGMGTVESTYAGSATNSVTFSNVAARAAGASGYFYSTGGTNGISDKIVLTQFGGVTTPTGTLLDKGLFFNDGTTVSYATYDSGGFVRAFGSSDAGYLAAPTGSTIGASTATSNVVLTTGNITAQPTVSANTINMGANSIAMSAAGQTLSVNGLLSSGASAATLNTGNVQPVSAGGEMVVNVVGASDGLNIGSIIQNNTSASALTKTGSGTLTLSGPNTYSGVTYIDGGVLSLANASALGGGGNITFNGGTLQYSASNTTDFSGRIVNSTGPISIDTGGQTITFATKLANTNVGGLIKNGAGTLILTTAGAYGGPTIINSGTLKDGAGSVLPDNLVQSIAPAHGILVVPPRIGFSR